MDDELGCDVCRAGIYSATEPRFAAATSPTDLLYRCAACRTWWYSDARSFRPLGPDEARRMFPTDVGS